MKRRFLVLFSMCVTLALHAQDTLAPTPTSKLGFAFRKLFLDNQSMNGGSILNFGEYSSGYEMAVKYRLQDDLLLDVPVRFGVLRPYQGEEDAGDSTNLRMFSLDAQLHYNLAPDKKLLQPSIYAGAGAVIADGGVDFQIPIGISFNFPFAKWGSIDWHSEFRKSFTDGRDNFQHGLGFTFWLGREDAMPMPKKEKEEEPKVLKDTDGDGVADDLDLCPYVPGEPEYFGCPDSDGDGIHDLKDKCPAIFGLAEFEGCPDSDADGVADNVDECPNLKGTKSNNGCPEPDKDGDGVADKDDRCPDVAGPAKNQGCPETIKNDSDGDGIYDTEDACPFAAGPAKFNGCPDSDNDGISDPNDDCPFSPGIKENRGCPEIKKEDRDVLELAMRAVQFDLGKATLRPESYRILDQIANILTRYDDYNLSISGHTDNTGSPSSNQRLSENRAKACYDYLITKGVNPNRLSYAGYGESIPIADNQSIEGRTLNRRVEFTLVPRRR